MGNRICKQTKEKGKTYNELRAGKDACLVELLLRGPPCVEEELRDVVLKNPEVCAIRYQWESHNAPTNVFPLWRVCEFQPSLELVQTIYAAHPPAIREVDESFRLDWSPLHAACSRNASTEVIRFLICKYRNALKQPDQFGWLPVHAACYRGASLDVIRLVASEYPRGLRNTEYQDCTPLHLACKANAPAEVIFYLVSVYQGALKLKDHGGLLPLHVACSSGDVSLDVIRTLVDAYQDGIKENDGNGWIPLHWACYNNKASLEVIQFLVSQHHEGLKERSGDGWLPLHHACDKGASLEVITFLVNEYPGGLEEEDSDGWLPLHWACYNKEVSVDVVRLLVSGNRQGLEVKCEEGWLPLHHACDKGVSVDVIRYLVSEYPGGLMEKDEDGWLPLHWACYNRDVYLDLICFLVSECHDSVKEMDDEGVLPIHLACRHGAPLEVISFLISSYPDSLGILASNMEWGRWRMVQEESRTFMFINDMDESLFASSCRSGENVSRITDTIQKSEQIKGVSVIGGGINGRMIQPLIQMLQANDTLLCLGLGNNPIGDVGATLLAKALSTNKTLQVLDIQKCGVGVVGLSSLLHALQDNVALINMDLSQNPGIFNGLGGQAIARRLSSSTYLERLYLFRPNEDFSIDFLEFLVELMSLLHWNPTRFSPIFLNWLLPNMLQTISYYQQQLHQCIISSDQSSMILILHFVLEQVNVLSQNNADLVFFYVKNWLAC